MSIGALELKKLPLVLLYFLLDILLVILNVLKLASHLWHYCAVTKSGRGRWTINSFPRIYSLL